MKIKTKIFLISSGLLFAGGMYMGHEVYKEKQIPKVEIVEKQKDGQIEIDVKEPEVNLADAFPEDMTEVQVIEAIHQMSHQKAQANEKWGAIPLTHERINRLIKIVKKNEYYNDYTYLEILNRWAKGDFSKADEDHNTVWNMLAGTRGEAEGLLTPEEEKQFIEENFKH